MWRCAVYSFINWLIGWFILFRSPVKTCAFLMRKQESCRWKRPSLSLCPTLSVVILACWSGTWTHKLGGSRTRQSYYQWCLRASDHQMLLVKWPLSVVWEQPGGAKGNFYQHHRWWRDKDQPGTGRRDRRQRAGEFPQQNDPSWLVASANLLH